MVNVSGEIMRRVELTHGAFVSGLSGVSASKIAHDALDESKVHDQIALFCETFGMEPSELRGKRILEVGSGFGIFLVVLRLHYGAESYGVEPSKDGFDGSFSIACEIMEQLGINPAIISPAMGENLPFPNAYFDFVFSSTVLEHTEDPALVIEEAIRVLKPGGRLQFVYPNYGAFFEGHYAIPWIPYLNHLLGTLWVRLWGRDPEFLNTLKFTNYFRTRKWLDGQNVEIVTLGEEIFRERMLTLNIKEWAGLGRIKRWVAAAHRLRIIRPLTWILLRMKSFDPIVLSLVKKSDDQTLSVPDNRSIYEVRWTDWTDMKVFGPSSRYLRALIGTRLNEATAIQNSGDVLDVGCGEGTTTNFLACHLPNSRVLGIDRSDLGIQCAKERYQRPNLNFACKEDSSTLESHRFALVTCFEVLEHVEDWRAMVLELNRLSSRYIMVSFPTGRMRSFERFVGHLRNFRRGQFERYASSIGLEPVGVCYAGFPFYSPLFREICNLTNSGGSSLTIGKYSWWQKRVGDVIFFCFRYLSLGQRGEQFCGLFQKRSSGRCKPMNEET